MNTSGAISSHRPSPVQRSWSIQTFIFRLLGGRHHARGAWFQQFPMLAAGRVNPTRAARISLPSRSWDKSSASVYCAEAPDRRSPMSRPSEANEVAELRRTIAALEQEVAG